ncbi:diacylglycerol kinase [Shewanella sp. OPT22]|nr:diacylglycerol kinase [Shewanella sp. OPT22]
MTLFDSSNKPTGFTRLKLALINSIKGFKWLLANESAFKQEMLMLIATILVLCIWNISIYEKLLLLVTALLVVFAEIINTAIEVVVDRISYEINPLSGLAKDLGSAGVFVSLTICGVSWLAVIYNNIL